VEHDGRYEISLRRWPKEAEAALTADLPAYKDVDGVHPPGKATPIAKARLKIGDVDVSKPVSKNDKAATFTVRLKAGKTKLRTWFHDEQGKELCGAFYVSVRRLDQDE